MDSQNAGLQINQGSQFLTTSHSACVLEELPPAEGQLPVITINHQIIRHVYRRREGGKAMKTKLFFSASPAISTLAKGKRRPPLSVMMGCLEAPDSRNSMMDAQPQSRTKPKTG
jgi:hypothetical protein